MPLSTPLPRASQPWLTAATVRLIVVVIAIVVLVADLVTPAEYDVSLFYGVAIALCAWSGSRRGLWIVTALVTIFVFLGACVGAPPHTNWTVVWVDRSLTAFSLLLIAAVVQAWMTNMSAVESQRLLTKHLLETVDLAQIVVRTIDGTILFWSHGAELLYGWSAEEATGKSVQELLRIDLGSSELAEIHRQLEQHWQWNGEVRHHRKDGKLIWVASQCTLDMSELYPHPVVTEVNNDITELMIAETRFRALADSLPQLIWQVTPEARITYVNRHWREYFQQEPEEITDAGEAASRFVHGDDVAGFLERWRKAVETGEMASSEIRFRRHDGVYRRFSDQAVAVRNEAGRVLYWLHTATVIEEENQSRFPPPRNSLYTP
jgi:PAS domain S-box-containing protein